MSDTSVPVPAPEPIVSEKDEQIKYLAEQVKILQGERMAQRVAEWKSMESARMDLAQQKEALASKHEVSNPAQAAMWREEAQAFRDGTPPEDEMAAGALKKILLEHQMLTSTTKAAVSAASPAAAAPVGVSATLGRGPQSVTKGPLSHLKSLSIVSAGQKRAASGDPVAPRSLAQVPVLPSGPLQVLGGDNKQTSTIVRPSSTREQVRQELQMNGGSALVTLLISAGQPNGRMPLTDAEETMLLSQGHIKAMASMVQSAQPATSTVTGSDAR